MKTLRLIVIIACSSILIFISNSCKKTDEIDDSFDKYIFSVKIDDEYWGTDDLTSKISQDQFQITNELFILSKICSENIEGRFYDSEIGWIFIQNFSLSFSIIDNYNKTYSAEFTGKCIINGIEKDISGTIKEAFYFSDVCEIQYSQSELDTFSLYGQWYLIGYNENNSNEYIYPPCLQVSEPYIEFIKNNDDNNQFIGSIVRNSFSGSFIVSSLNTIQIISFESTLVYICWDFDREYETFFFDTLKDSENLNFSITNNILTLESSTNGKRYIFFKHYE